MAYRFKAGRKYSGETVYGGCGYVVSNIVTILKRTKSTIIYEDRWGNIIKTKRHYHIKSEFFSDTTESFYADSIEPLPIK